MADQWRNARTREQRARQVQFNVVQAREKITLSRTEDHVAFGGVLWHDEASRRKRLGAVELGTPTRWQRFRSWIGGAA